MIAAVIALRGATLVDGTGAAARTNSLLVLDNDRILAARSLGVGNNRGTLEPGKRGDFLVLKADPLADVENVCAIAAVYKSGRVVPPPQ